jgi:hypothetical protein
VSKVGCGVRDHGPQALKVESSNPLLVQGKPLIGPVISPSPPLWRTIALAPLERCTAQRVRSRRPLAPRPAPSHRPLYWEARSTAI